MTKPFFPLDVPIYGGKILVVISDEPWADLKAAKVSTGGRKRKEAKLCYAWVEQLEKEPALIPGTTDKARWIVAITLKHGVPPKEIPEDLMMDTIAHECYHLTNYLAAWYGLSVEAGLDEAPAYIHGYLMKNIWKFLVEAKNAVHQSDNND